MPRSEVLVREYKKQLPVRLLLEEKAEYSQELTVMMRDLDDLKEVGKTEAARHKDKVKQLEGRIARQRDIVFHGEVDREIRVEEHHDPIDRVARTYRQDTGAEVACRDLTDAELAKVRQTELKLAGVTDIKATPAG